MQNSLVYWRISVNSESKFVSEACSVTIIAVRFITYVSEKLHSNYEMTLQLFWETFITVIAVETLNAFASVQTLKSPNSNIPSFWTSSETSELGKVTNKLEKEKK
jgi:hypothetical protein